MSNDDTNKSQDFQDEICETMTVHQLTHRPDYLWTDIKKQEETHYKERLQPLPLDSPRNSDCIRFVCISDTHSKTASKTFPQMPSGDVLLHAGDFTKHGSLEEIEEFNTFLGNLPYKYKIVIAGNHDLLFDKSFFEDRSKDLKWTWGIDAELVTETLQKRQLDSIEELLSNCTYLQDSGTEVCGIKIWGSPWQPTFCGWAFNLERGEPLLDKWNCIPGDVDILMTHGPPLGYGDKTSNGYHVGCVELLNTVQKRVKPKYHVFGHIHEGYGMTRDCNTVYINASTCDKRYRASQSPIVFDIPCRR